MTNVHSRNIRRGHLAAPVVTMDHAEAQRLAQQQSDAFWGSWFGVVVMLVLVIGLPIGIMAAIGGYNWGTPGAIILPSAVIGLLTLGVVFSKD